MASKNFVRLPTLLMYASGIAIRVVASCRQSIPIRGLAVRPTNILHSWIILGHRIIAAIRQDDSVEISTTCASQPRSITG